MYRRTAVTITLMMATTLSSVSAHQAHAQATDAISREFTVFNDISDSVALDAITREFTAFNDISDSVALDAITREFTAFNDLVNPVVITDAISREFTGANLLLNAWSIDLSTSLLRDVDVISSVLGNQTALVNWPSGTKVQLSAPTGQEQAVALIDPGVGVTLAAELNLVSGQVSSAVITSAADVRGVAVDPFTGDQYCAYASVDTVNNLGFLSPLNGKINPVGPLTFQASTAGGRWIDMLAFAPNGILYGLQNLGAGAGMKLWAIDKITLIATEVGVTAATYSDYDDMGFLGADLWAIKQGAPSTAIMIDKTTVAVTTTTTLWEGTMAGITQANCILPNEGILTAADTPADGGGSNLLSWAGYTPPAGFARYEIYRSQDPCVVEQRTMAPMDSILSSGTMAYTDSTVANYEQYFYRVSVFVTGQQLPVDQFFAGPAVAHPNVIINEFNPTWAPQQVEILSNANVTVNLNGFRISNGPGLPSPDVENVVGSVPANSVFVHTLASVSFAPAGGRVILLPPVGNGYALDDVRYGNQGGADTAPQPLTTSRVLGTGATAPDATSFSIATETFGATNLAAPPELGTSLVFNEVFFDTTLASAQYVELYNPSGTTVDLSQIAINDGVTVSTLSTGSTLKSGEMVLLQEGAPGSFQAPISSNTLYLYKIDQAGAYVRIDQLGWSGGPFPLPASPGNALVRVPDGAATYYAEQAARWNDSGGDLNMVYGEQTPGTANHDPRVIQSVVDPAGDGDFLTLTDALAAAAPGTNVFVKGGTYFESVVVPDSVTIVGAQGSPDSVKITGVGGMPALTVPDSITTFAARGLTFSGCDADTGGAVLLLGGSSTFTNVAFKFNHAKKLGGAVAIRRADASFDGCLFYSNSSKTDGGAVAVLDTSLTVPEFVDCVFVRNSALGRGAVIYSETDSTLVRHSVFDRNWSNGAGGGSGLLHSRGGVIDVAYSIFSQTRSDQMFLSDGGRINLACTAFDSTNVAMPDSGIVDSTSMFFGDPMYCQPAALNYALSVNSPLLDTGCLELVGVGEPPCVQITTDVPDTAPVFVTRLHRAAPNPFNPKTTLSFELAQKGRVRIAVYDLRGRFITDILSPTVMAAGTHEASWDGTDRRHRGVSSGVYFARLVFNGRAVGRSQRMVLLK